jgi:sRNA-binding carbon storage regulator CsrA
MGVLKLGRRKGERVVIQVLPEQCPVCAGSGCEHGTGTVIVEVEVCEIRGSAVGLGFKADKERVLVDREEVYESKLRERGIRPLQNEEKGVSDEMNGKHE